MQSIELLVDDALAAEVRAEWDVLARAGLPSQARHTGATNAPHVTLGVSADPLDDATEARLAGLDYGVGSPLTLGGLLVFPRRTAVLARLVVPTEHLLAVQRSVHDALPAVPDRPAHTAPGTWTPHVTLARRLDADQLAAALHALAGRPRELTGTVSSARRWDGDAKVTWDVGR